MDETLRLVQAFQYTDHKGEGKCCSLCALHCGVQTTPEIRPLSLVTVYGLVLTAPSLVPRLWWLYNMLLNKGGGIVLKLEFVE